MRPREIWYTITTTQYLLHSTAFPMILFAQILLIVMALWMSIGVVFAFMYLTRIAPRRHQSD